MCGIAGSIDTFYNHLIDSQVHRGPDAVRMSSLVYDVNDRSVFFSHNRLSIIDLSEFGNQPMLSSDCRYMLTYNGEIYNYVAGNGNDAQWLLNKITKDGLDAAISQSVGMFAFALYDNIEKKIHLVVDRMGEKPLYYFHDGDQFAFASSPAALLNLKEKWEINKEALDSYWLLGGVMKDSIWKGIKRVHAAEHVVFDVRTRAVSTERYWEPQYQNNTSGLEDLIYESINNVKVADVPVYIFLSGGIDSTVVASQFPGKHAIHMDGPEYTYAKKVADKFGITLHKISPKSFDATEVMKDYSTKSGEPTMAGMIPWITSSEASKLCKVAISANGGDELFFGYDRTSQNITGDQLAHIFRDIPTAKYSIPKIDPRLSSGRWLELMTYVQHDLNRTLDFASMCHSLEVRSPFLDYRLVEMALSIPQKQIGRKDPLKNILRKHGFESAFLNRPKMGFSLYVKPNNLMHLQMEALKYLRSNGYMPWYSEKMSRRDQIYLQSAALGFYYWLQTFKHKLL